MIQESIKIILVEDTPVDVFLIEREIKKILANPIIKVVAEFQEFKILLNRFEPDIILCDYQLPSFTGFDVLQYLKKYHQYIPFVFVTGTIKDEELAANSILTVPTGYVLKKNMNVLHEKLLPHFKEIVKLEKNEHNSIIDIKASKAYLKESESYLTYLETLESSNKEVKNANDKLKKELEEMKLELKKNYNNKAT